MANCEDVRYDDEATIWLASLCRKAGFELGHAVNGTDNRLPAVGRGGSSKRVQITIDKRRCRRVVQKREPPTALRNICQDVHPLTGQRTHTRGETEHYAARPR